MEDKAKSHELPRAAAIVNEFKRKFCEEAELLSVATGMNWHIQFWRHQDSALDLHKEKPKEDTLYWCFDFADPCFQFYLKIYAGVLEHP